MNRFNFVYFSRSIYIVIFIFPPGAHVFLKYLVIVNFIFLCKLYIMNIEKSESNIFVSKFQINDVEWVF